MTSTLRPSLTQAARIPGAATIGRKRPTDYVSPSHRSYASSSSQASSSHQPSSSSFISPPPASTTPSPPLDPPVQQSTSSSSVPPPSPPKKPLSQSAIASEQDRLPLPWLSRPLGVASKPLSLTALAAQPKPSRSQRASDYLSGGRQTERENIVKSATKGYFHDFHSLKAHGGKTWRAPATMIREDRALWFPQVAGTCLADRTTKDTVEMTSGKVSVVAILNSRISEEHTKSFYSPTLDLYSSHPSFQLLQINLQPNLLKHYLISLFLSSLRAQIPQPLHKGYLLTKLDLDNPSAGQGRVHREDLGMANKHVGYTYLVDQNGKIRWAGGGFAEKGEREALVACTGVLLGRASGV